MQESIGKGNIQEKKSSFLKGCKNWDTLCENLVLVAKLCEKPLKGVKNFIFSILILELVILMGISLAPMARLN